MKYVIRLKFKRCINSVSMTSYMVLAIGTMMFFTAFCEGQTSNQTIEYETPGVLDAYDVLPPDLLKGSNFWVDRKVDVEIRKIAQPKR